MESSNARPGIGGALARTAPGIVFVAAYFLARVIIELDGVPAAWKGGAAFLPLPALAWMLAGIVRGIRTMDELEQRIHLEALAVAFPIGFAILMTLGLLELAIELPPEDLGYRHVWASFPLLYFAGMILARRRYR